MANLIDNPYYGKIIFVIMTIAWVIVTIVLVAQTLNNSKELRSMDEKVAKALDNTVNLTRSFNEKITKIDLTEKSAEHSQDISTLEDKINELKDSYLTMNNTILKFNQSLELGLKNKSKEVFKRIDNQWKNSIHNAETLLSKLTAVEYLIQQNNITFNETIKKCPNDSVELETRCFSFHSPHLNWEGSYDYCLNQGGFMPQFPDKNFDFKDFSSAFPQIKIKTAGYSSVKVWLNAKDVIVEGEWLWESGSKLSTHDSRWANDQPNNYGGGQHCVTATYNSDGFLGLEDYACDVDSSSYMFKYLYVLCEHTPQIY